MNVAIEDPWHSRPIDVHRWSDHPEAIKLSNELWDEFFPELANEDSRPGPKPKTSFRNQFKVVLMDLWVAWNEDPELSIGVPMGETGWDTNSRYNALHLSKKIIAIVHQLHELGLILLAKGSYSGPYGLGNRNTRIRASAKLVERFEAAQLTPEMVIHHPDREVIILKDGNAEAGPSREIEYEDTPATIAMREMLQAYNTLLANTFIDIPSLDEPFIERVRASGPEEGQVQRISVLPHRTFTRRIFSRGSWECNGRFYGGWWQQVDRKTRSRIFLDDQPTIEVDFKGMHVAMLSLEKGVTLEGDPYELPEGLVASVSPLEQRALVKKLALTAINAPSVEAAFGAFRNEWPTEHFGKSMKNDQLKKLLTAFLEKHPHLEDCMGADQGIRLMHIDSKIAERLISLFTAASVPLLSIHDSFIVPYDQTFRLKRFMPRAAEVVMGHRLEVDSLELGLDEVTDWPRYRQLDFIHWRELARSPGYLQRLAAHEAKAGRVLGVGGLGSSTTRGVGTTSSPSSSSITSTY